MQKSYHSGGSSRSSSPQRSFSSFGGGSRRSRPGGSGGYGGSRRPAPSKNIHPSKFINKSVVKVVETPYESTNQFSDFNLNSKTQEMLLKLGFVSPSAIQDQCINPALEGKDIIGLANTGTGKTAAFLLPTIEKLYKGRRPVSALVLAPTRELAQQIEQEFKRFSPNQNLYSTLVVGGMNIGRQIAQVKRGPHIIIGTPGRIKDLMGRGVLRLDGVETFILDEADRMCDMGFSKDIRAIAQELPKERQTLCFSATMTSDVKIIVEEFMVSPITISVVQEQNNNHIEQDVIVAGSKDEKTAILAEMLAKEEFKKVLIFGETKFGVQRLSDALNSQGLSTIAIHGNKNQSQRDRALRSFKQGEFRALVATDVAARGLDVPDVTHVINFDQPKTYDDYVHRIGRTGRAGKSGKAFTFVSR